jgi:hypothetical protein
MLVVGLRSPLRSLLGDTWFYKRFEVLPYKFGFGGSLITTMIILITILIFLKWMNNRARTN